MRQFLLTLSMFMSSFCRQLGPFRFFSYFLREELSPVAAIGVGEQEVLDTFFDQGLIYMQNDPLKLTATTYSLILVFIRLGGRKVSARWSGPF